MQLEKHALRKDMESFLAAKLSRLKQSSAVSYD